MMAPNVAQNRLLAPYHIQAPAAAAPAAPAPAAPAQAGGLLAPYHIQQPVPTPAAMPPGPARMPGPVMQVAPQRFGFGPPTPPAAMPPAVSPQMPIAAGAPGVNMLRARMGF